MREMPLQAVRCRKGGGSVRAIKHIKAALLHVEVVGTIASG